MTRHCHGCGWEWTFRDLPGRSETCPQCRTDLRVCLNCAFYDRRAAHHCRDGRADPVEEKAQANFCEYFDFAKRPWTGPASKDREADARAALRSLLGD
ncbi:MAG: hypothetical protein J0L84_01900 [Verrucomicrobia bacterium]|nr:hypothetical protein [Verrucomicrobiota bacterium]